MNKFELSEVYEEGNEVFYTTEADSMEDALQKYYEAQDEEETETWGIDCVRVVDPQGKESFYKIGCKVVPVFYFEELQDHY